MDEPQNGCPDCQDLKGAPTPTKYCSGGPKCMNNTYPNTSGFVPLGHRLLVKPDPIEKITESGIVLVEETTGRDEMAQVRGTVIAVGSGCWKDTTVGNWASPGDRIVFGKFSGLQWAGHDKGRYRILNDLDVVGLVVDEIVVAEVVTDEVPETTPALPAPTSSILQIVQPEDLKAALTEVENAS